VAGGWWLVAGGRAVSAAGGRRAGVAERTFRWAEVSSQGLWGRRGAGWPHRSCPDDLSRRAGRRERAALPCAASPCAVVGTCRWLTIAQGWSRCGQPRRETGGPAGAMGAGRIRRYDARPGRCRRLRDRTCSSRPRALDREPHTSRVARTHCGRAAAPEQRATGFRCDLSRTTRRGALRGPQRQGTRQRAAGPGSAAAKKPRRDDDRGAAPPSGQRPANWRAADWRAARPAARQTGGPPR